MGTSYFDADNAVMFQSLMKRIPQCRRQARFYAVRAGLLGALVVFASCAVDDQPESGDAAVLSQAPDILLITLDTARADAFGFDNGTNVTPILDQLAAEGVQFSNAFATAPMTLPSHTSMFTGLYPPDHGVHENARNLDPTLPLLAESISAAGYETAAFVSALPLASRFGLARGFSIYDDVLNGKAERSGTETTDAALRYLQQAAAKDNGDSKQPLFLWVHYFDPHAPYEAAEVVSADTAIGSLGADVSRRYLSEIAAVDREIGRLLEGFRLRANTSTAGQRILVVGDHGESLGDFGERTHGNLLHPSVLRVPLLVSGDPEQEPGSVIDRATSVRRTFGTILNWAGAQIQSEANENQSEHAPGSSHRQTVFDPPETVVLGEAMQPYLQYGWQPQVSGVPNADGSPAASPFVLLEGSADVGAVITAFDLTTGSIDEHHEVSPAVRQALRGYALPSRSVVSTDASLSQESRSQLASLGYVTNSQAPARINANSAPRASQMTHLFGQLDAASIAFESRNFNAAIEPLTTILNSDPNNFAAALRLAVAHSALEAGGQDAGSADRYFALARELSPASSDLRHFEGMHFLSRGEPASAVVLFESVLNSEPNRTTTLGGLYQAKAALGDVEGAADALAQLARLEPNSGLLIQLGRLRMRLVDASGAIEAFEQARILDPASFDLAPGLSLDLGVLYLAERRFREAKLAIDQAIASAENAPDATSASPHPTLPMALFKRAQAAVLLNEPDARQRIAEAQRRADSTTRQLIQTERLFEGLLQ